MVSYVHTVYTYIHIQNSTCFTIFSTMQTRNEMNERLLNNRLEVKCIIHELQRGPKLLEQKEDRKKIRNDFDSGRDKKKERKHSVARAFIRSESEGVGLRKAALLSFLSTLQPFSGDPPWV